MSAAPSVADLWHVLVPTYPDRSIRLIEVRPYEYATSHALTLVTVVFEDDGRDVLVLKDFDEVGLLAGARAHRGAGTSGLPREIEVYRHVLAPAGLGPRCQAIVADPQLPRHWLLTERVAGVELWQVGEIDVWETVAGWLGAMHAGFGEGGDAARWVPRLDRAWFEAQHRRALAALGSSADRRAARVRALVQHVRLDRRLADMPRTFVHGELYPSNVLVRDVAETPRARVVPVDWETAAIGPAMLDLAALGSGWDDGMRARLSTAYGEPVDVEALACCRLHLALRWLAAPQVWEPPAEHRQDWIAEALLAGEEVAA